MFADRYDALLFDLDGVLYRGDESVAHAVETLASLREAGARVAFLTNNSSRTPEQVVDILRMRPDFHQTCRSECSCGHRRAHPADACVGFDPLQHPAELAHAFVPLRKKSLRVASLHEFTRRYAGRVSARSEPPLELFRVRDCEPCRPIPDVQVRYYIEGAPSLEGRRLPPGRSVQR